MKAKQPYLKGKSVFIVSCLVLGITIFTVYFTGINYNRSLTSNLYWSLGIIAAVLFLFMTYGLYKGIGLIDNFPKFKSFKKGDYISHSAIDFKTPSVDVGEGIAGFILSILFMDCNDNFDYRSTYCSGSCILVFTVYSFSHAVLGFL